MGKRANSCPAEQEKYFTARKGRLLNPHAPGALNRLCNTIYWDGSLDGTDSNKKLWRMLSSKFVLHQGADTEYALWISLGRWENVSFQAPRTEQRICFTKVGFGYTMSSPEHLARWVTWSQLHLWKGRCEQRNNSRKMLSWVHTLRLVRWTGQSECSLLSQSYSLYISLRMEELGNFVTSRDFQKCLIL